jgi:hypothetical protein
MFCLGERGPADSDPISRPSLHATLMRIVAIPSAVLLVLVLQPLRAAGQEPIARAATSSPGWTLDEALAHLRFHRRDAYVQYAALQLARREGRLPDVMAQVQELTMGRMARFGGRPDRTEGVDLVSIFSGALAVQESLQLDAMREGTPLDPDAGSERIQRADPPGARGREPGADPEFADAGRMVALSDLSGPTIQSHPWNEMLAGRTPAVSRLSRSVPEDFYFVECASVNKLIEASELANLWGTHLFSQAVQEAQSQLVERRLREQLAVEVSPLLRPFYDAVVREVAVTGSDPFLREGSDVTLLFHLRQPALFRAKMDEYLTAAESSRPDVRRTTGTILGFEFVHVATADRRIHVFSAYPAPDLHVRTNSRVALQRVLSAIRGETVDGGRVRRLGETEEFAYIRTLMPHGAEEEDVFIYLSDPFIRRLVGPVLRLTEHRRMVCYNHLKMIGHAALMYGTERGKYAASLDELEAAECTPGAFGQGNLVCPDGGQYSLAADGLSSVCSHHGYAHYLTPCSEIETQRVTPAEAAAYERFLMEYNSYWRTFFDPIAIRLQITPERYRAETIVLPLIDNSIYTGLAAVLGGSPEPLEPLAVPQRNIFSVAVRFNKAELLRQAGLEALIEDDPTTAGGQSPQDTARATEALRQLVLGMHTYHDATNRFPAAHSVDAEGRPLLSWRVHLLPYIETEDAAIYEEFRLNEPWDSEHNKKLIPRMPAVFRPASPQLAADGKTRFVVPRGEGTIFPTDNASVQIEQIQDGVSNTVLINEVDDEHAVVWTKPDDLAVEPDEPQRGLAMRPGGHLMAFSDGSTHLIRSEIEKAALAAVFTHSGGELVDWQRFDRPAQGRQGPLGEVPYEVIETLGLGELLTAGIGNQIAFHVYDAEPLVDINMSRLLGMSAGSFGGRGGFNDELLFIAPLVGSLTSPVYLSIPVQDERVVDQFLGRLDAWLAEQARRPPDRVFFSFDQDFYQLQLGEGQVARSFALRVGPLKWRFFWSRMGESLYVASKPEILGDLATIPSHEESPGHDDMGPAHAAVRVRPQNWNRVLDNLRLGWEENNRMACLNNLGPLSSLRRAIVSSDSAASSAAPSTTLNELAGRVYDVHYYCPDGGEYAPAADGKSIVCTVHGTAQSPRQDPQPGEQSEVAKLLRDLADMYVTLSFLEDGLHAVVTIGRGAGAR